MTTTLWGLSMIGGDIQKRYGVCLRMFLLVVSLGCTPTATEGSSFSFACIRIQGSTEPAEGKFFLGVLTSERTHPARVGSIMALLATLDEAEILPPEGTLQANQLIHGLIQLQGAFLKSSSHELADYLMVAERQWVLKSHEREYETLATAGLTSRVLEALIFQNERQPMWENPKIVAAMQEFNVTDADWVLIVDVVKQAEAVFDESGRSIHDLYDQWRVKMPGGKS